MNKISDKHRRRLQFGWNKRRPVSSEHQVKYRPGWYEMNGRRVSAPRSHKTEGWQP